MLFVTGQASLGQALKQAVTQQLALLFNDNYF